MCILRVLIFNRLAQCLFLVVVPAVHVLKEKELPELLLELFGPILPSPFPFFRLFPILPREARVSSDAP